MKYKIGLDIGITSIGWAVVLLDENNEAYKIDKLGVRIFDAAEHPKDGASLALPRREARSSRRRLRRHRHRIERLKQLFENTGLISVTELNEIFQDNKNNTDIYKLRVEALERLINNSELSRVLIHIAQRRGFKSNRKSEISDKKTGALLNAVSENQEVMLKNNYRTVGEMFYKDERFAQTKRNKDEYIATVARDRIAEELETVLKCQQKFGNRLISDKFTDDVKSIVLSQRKFDEGPGRGSKYSGNQIEKMIGKCTLEPDEYRAAKTSYTFEYFKLLQDINNFFVYDNSSKRYLSAEEKTSMRELALKVKDLKYSRIRKELSFGENIAFALNYNGTEKDAEQKKFEAMKAFHEIRTVLDKFEKNLIYKVPHEMLDEIGYAFTAFKNDEAIQNYIQSKNVPAEYYEALLNLKGFSGFGNLSLKAMRRIIPYLEQGLTYDKAATNAGYSFKGHAHEENMYIPFDIIEKLNIPNPVVIRAISQCRKVINSIIRFYGKSPAFINIEFAREMSKNFIERNIIVKKQAENRKENEKAKTAITEIFGINNVTGLDIIKFRLYKEQNGFCPYSQSVIELERLYEPGYVDVDHIIPFSLCFNDSYANKILVKSNENRRKKNSLAMAYMQNKSMSETYETWVNTNIRNPEKRRRLLKADYTEEDSREWKTRSLNDTKYIARQMYNLINDSLAFDTEGSEDKIKRVTAVNGNMTAYMRKRWGITKLRENGDIHHCVDAAVIACISDGLIAKVTRYSKYNENREDMNDDESMKRFPPPYADFRNELTALTDNSPSETLKQLKIASYVPQETENAKPIFVSRMVNHKVSGPGHKETVMSTKKADEGVLIKKVALTELKVNKKSGEIEGYFNKQDDMLLYNALKQRLKEFDNDAKKAFNDIFCKPKANGEKGNPVKKVKIEQKSNIFVPVLSGTGGADNDSMIRIDVFYVEKEGYYFVPIYAADAKKKTLPNKACVAFKSYSEWKEMDDKDFLFSLYKNDVIKFKAKTPTKFSLTSAESDLPENIYLNDALVCFQTAGISGASIHVITSDNAYKVSSMGIKTLLSLEKYETDILGNVRKVGKESRRYFN